MKTGKSTMKELVDELVARNKDGRFDGLIAGARSGRYHDFKNPEDVACGKVQFILETEPFAEELRELRDQIINGEYDESPDEADEKMMREELLKDGSSDGMFSILGFVPPTPQERAYWNAKRNLHKN